MIPAIDLWLENNASWLDALALFVVMGIALKQRSAVSLVVLLDFALTILGYSLIKNMEIWPDIDMDHQYVLGTKDALVAWILFLMAANPLLTLYYIMGAFSCWLVWGGYEAVLSYKLDYYVWLGYFFGWSPIYFCIMLLEICGLSHGESDAGKHIRNKIVPIDWSRILRPVNSLANTRITTSIFSAQRASK